MALEDAETNSPETSGILGEPNVSDAIGKIADNLEPTPLQTTHEQFRLVLENFNAMISTVGVLSAIVAGIVVFVGWKSYDGLKKFIFSQTKDLLEKEFSDIQTRLDKEKEKIQQ